MIIDLDNEILVFKENKLEGTLDIINLKERIVYVQEKSFSLDEVILASKI